MLSHQMGVPRKMETRCPLSQKAFPTALAVLMKKAGVRVMVCFPGVIPPWLVPD